MYAVIYWDKLDLVRFVASADDSVWLADSLNEADKKAGDFEKRSGVECRVVSLEGVTGE